MTILNAFFFYSFLGWLWEIGCAHFNHEKPGSGILYGPWTPIYGIGALLILKLYKNFLLLFHFPKYIEIPISIFCIVIFVTILEWIAGILIEKIFHYTFWNYNKFKYHIGKYIALEISLLWAFSSFILIYILHPFLLPYFSKIPQSITIIISILFIVDCSIIFIRRKIHR